MAVRVTPGVSMALSDPAALFRVPDELLGVEALYYTPWDVARDGRFIMARMVDGDQDHAGAIIVVENWFEELGAKVKK